MGSVNTILQANNKTRVAKAEWRAAVANTQNQNKLEAAKVGFSDFMRTLSNNARVKAASDEYNWQMESLSEELRASHGKSFNTQIQLAAAQGALTAQAGYVGVGGSSADLMDTMVGLQAEMDQEAQENARNLLASRGATQRAQIMTNAFNGMDMSRTFGQFDFSQHIEPKRMKRRFGKLVGVAVATFFGGPMAGQAVADFAVGTWQAENANFDGASQSFDRAAQGALGAFSQWGQRGGKPWGTSVFGNNPSSTSPTFSQGARITQLGNNYDNFQTTTSGLGWFEQGGGNGYW